MRPLLAICLSVLVLGTVQAYMWFVQSLPEGPGVQQISRPASQDHRLEIVATFDILPDAFSDESLTVLLLGQPVFRSQQPIPAGTVIRVDQLPGLVQGDNEFYVRATAPYDEQEVPRAVRVRAFRGDQVLDDITLWVRAAGEPVEGTVRLRVEPEQAQPEHEH